MFCWAHRASAASRLSVPVLKHHEYPFDCSTLMPAGHVMGGDGGGDGGGGDGGGDGGGGDGGGDGIHRGPQSAQSVPSGQPSYSDPGPPSLHSPLDNALLLEHVFSHMQLPDDCATICSAMETMNIRLSAVPLRVARAESTRCEPGGMAVLGRRCRGRPRVLSGRRALPMSACRFFLRRARCNLLARYDVSAGTWTR